LGIQTAYADVVEKDSLVPDQSQQNIVDAMQRLQEQLEARPGWLQSVRAVFNTRQHAVPQKGLYLWGGVGRGKTFLMDLFFHSLDVPRKKRIHFHRMMREVHERLSAVGNIENPLDHIAGEIASETRVLCFDEFFVSDIGDAMLLGKLLDGLFSRGVTLVTTSNSPPERLYPDGLQRERFLPAIALLEQHTDVVEMDGGIDYRLKLLKQAGTYLTPADEAAQHKLQQYFASIARVGRSAVPRVWPGSTSWKFAMARAARMITLKSLAGIRRLLFRTYQYLIRIAKIRPGASSPWSMSSTTAA